MTMNEGQALHNSPYVEQIEKFAASLKQLSQTFLGWKTGSRRFPRMRSTACLTG